MSRFALVRGATNARLTSVTVGTFALSADPPSPAAIARRPIADTSDEEQADANEHQLSDVLGLSDKRRTWPSLPDPTGNLAIGCAPRRHRFRKTMRRRDRGCGREGSDATGEHQNPGQPLDPACFSRAQRPHLWR